MFHFFCFEITDNQSYGYYHQDSARQGGLEAKVATVHKGIVGYAEFHQGVLGACATHVIA